MNKGDDFFIPTETISFGKAKITVRGLSYADITKLLTVFNIASLDQFLDSTLGEFEKLDFGKIVISFPNQAAHIIALAADMSDRVSEIARMPAPAQTQALYQIYKLTVEETGGIEGFFGLVLAILKGMNQTLPDLSSFVQTAKSNLKNTG